MGSYDYSRVTMELAKAGGIPPEEKQKAGEESIVLARQALEIHTQLYGTASIQIASTMRALASSLDYFNDVDDEEVLCLFEQAMVIYRRVEGNSSKNVGATEDNLGGMYIKRANRAMAAHDQDRCLKNLKLALPRFREAARIYRAINHEESANVAQSDCEGAEEVIRRLIKIKIEETAAIGV